MKPTIHKINEMWILEFYNWWLDKKRIEKESWLECVEYLVRFPDSVYYDEGTICGTK